MAERRDLGQERRVDVLSGDEHFDRLDPAVDSRLHEILTLCDEEPELVAPAAVVQLPDELELLVVERSDQDCWAGADLARRRRFATPTIKVAWALPAQPSNAPRWFTKRFARAPPSPFARWRRRPAGRSRRGRRAPCGRARSRPA